MIFECQLRKRVELAMNGRFATPLVNGLLLVCGCFQQSSFFANIKAVFLFWIIRLLPRIPCFLTSQTMNSSQILKSGHKATNHGAFRQAPARIYATDGVH